jgi:prevent-host-death family protein
MKQVAITLAKSQLSTLVEEAAAGEEIVITKHGKPRARLVPLAASTAKPRRKPEFGFWSHYGWKLPENFDEPDPEIEAMFYGGDEDDTT